jgi:short-subunit dehydrogenase
LVLNFRGKRALVTGAAGGIGRAIALELAREGADLFLVDIDEVRPRVSVEEAEKTGAKTAFQICDISRPDQVSACVAACLATYSGLDILINSAGVLRYGAPYSGDKEAWNTVISVNLLAPIQFTIELLPSLIAQEESHILNVCSIVGLVPARKLASYQTSKFGLVGFSLAMRHAYFEQNVGVTALCPGLVDTSMLEEMGPRWLNQAIRIGPLLPISSPDEIARHAIASMRKNRSIVIPSLFGKLLWMVYRLAPSLYVWLFSRRFRLRKRGFPAPSETTP